MCGIAGNWGEPDETLVKTMVGRLVHRGPDAEGLHCDERGVLGHTRLSIMDVVGGNQPLYGPGRRETIVANGEIYNHPQLRKRLGRQRRFRTHSDSESVLHLYGLEGPNAAAQLDGMFAVAIADSDGLYLARDPLGIKPLYYARDGEQLAFASELKALADSGGEIREFPPGTWYHTSRGFQQYYVVPRHAPEQRSVADWQRAVRETLERAVQKRLMADVPVGAFLSGGLDSSIIVALARQHLDELHTFSVGIEGSRDLEAARVVAEHLDTNHHEYALTIDEIVAKLPEIIYALESFDQDLVRSGIPCYFTSRLAAEHLKVILTGEGADELFCGYTYYQDIADPAALHAELRRSVTALHNVNLQRVDRLTMAHSIEGRVPFLDLELIDLAQRIPVDLKLRPGRNGRRVEKWILRKAVEDLLPREIVWRVKEQFDEGSGTVDILTAAIQQRMGPRQAAAYRESHPGAKLRSAEECYYHRLLNDVFPDAEPILSNVARWAQRPVQTAKSA